MKTYKQVLETSEGRLPVNVIDWAENFLELRLWDSQKEVLLSIFEEKCPVCPQELVTPAAWAEAQGQPPTVSVLRSGLQELWKWHEMEKAYGPSIFENNECPMCGTTRSAGLLSGKLKGLSHVYGVFGQRGGISTMLFAAITYWLQLIKRDGGWSTIVKKYGLDCTSEYEVSFPSLTGTMQEKNLHHWVYEHLRPEGKRIDFSEVLAFADPAWRGLVIGNGWAGTKKAAVFLPDASWLIEDRPNGGRGITSTQADKLRDEIAGMRKTCQKVPRGPSSSYRPLLIASSSPRSSDDWLVKQVRERAIPDCTLTFWKPTWEMNPSLPKDGPAMKKMLAAGNGQRDFGLVFDQKPDLTPAQAAMDKLKAIANKVQDRKREEENKKFSDLADLKKVIDSSIEKRWKLFEEEFVVENFERFKSTVEKEGRVRLEGEKYTLLTTFPWPVGPELVNKLWASGFASIGSGNDDPHGHPIYTSNFSFLNVKITAHWEEDSCTQQVQATFDFRI